MTMSATDPSNITDRFYRTFTYQPVDRVPDIEFGYWPQTIRRWLKEGLPLSLTKEETGNFFCPKLDQYFGFDQGGCWLPIRTGMNPAFEEIIIERRANSVIKRDAMGITAECFNHDQEESSIPHYLKFPVESPADWTALKERFRLDDPNRVLPSDQIETVRDAMRNGSTIMLSFFRGPYGQLRDWLGTENLSYAFYDMPEVIHDMVLHWSELIASLIEQLPTDIRIDCVNWSEDLAGRNGPLCSPSHFQEFLQPGYHRVMTAARKRGCRLSQVDSDGNVGPIIPYWLTEGVNIMFPIEIEAGADPSEWRRQFGQEIRLRGGIRKQPLVEGGSAIDRELDRIRPLFEQGGYVPHLDHLVPPDVSYKNYCEYLEKKRKLIGKSDSLPCADGC